MLSFDQESAAKILCFLDAADLLFPQFKLYKIENKPRVLGEGGFSVVYDMVNKERPECHYALKVIGFQKHVITSEDFWNTSRYQAILCQESSNITRMIDAKELTVDVDSNGEVKHAEKSAGEEWDDDKLHIQALLMERLEDIIVKDRFHNASLTRRCLMEEREALRLASQVGRALALAHSYNIMHRDVKLENIFWDGRKKCYKLGDFGISKLAEDGKAETVVYTDGYGAPEIERRLGDYYNVTADIYSLGITIYLLLNDLKFPGSDGYYAKVEAQYNPDFVFPAPARASGELTRVIRKMCGFRMEDRYQSMREALLDLAYVAEKDGIGDAAQYVEFADLATETYRAEGLGKSADTGEIEKPKTRMERKEERLIEDSIYRTESVKYFFALTVLLVLLFKGTRVDTAVISNMWFWMIPIAVGVDAALLGIGEQRIFWGTLIMVFSTLSISMIGLTMPHIVLIICTIMSVPVVSASGACAVGIWMFLEMNQRAPFLDILEKYDLEWLVLVLIFLVARGLLETRITWERITDIRKGLGQFLYNVVFLVMIIGGIVLLILQYFGVLVIPELVAKTHLVRTGIISFFGMMVFDWEYGVYDDMCMD